jgi:tetratricopeptide (TPR) repeat protein
MRKTVFGLLLFFISFNFFSNHLHAQSNNIDSLVRTLSTAREDSNKVKTLNRIGSLLQWNDPKKAMDYLLPALALSQKLHYTMGEIHAYVNIGEALGVSGNYTKAIELKLKALALAENENDEYLLGRAYLSLSSGYFYQGDYDQTLRYAKKALDLPAHHKKQTKVLTGFLGEAFFKLGQLDSALFYTQKAYELDLVDQYHWTIPYYYLAAIFSKKGDHQRAVEYYRKGLSFNPPKLDVVDGHLGLAEAFHRMRKNDSALHYMHRAIGEGKEFSFEAKVAEAAALGKDIYKQEGKADSAFYYSELLTAAKDSLFSQEKIKQLLNLTFNEQLREQEAVLLKQKQEEDRKHSLQYVATAIAVILFLILFFLFSYSIVANPKLIRFLGVVALLVVFEFVNLLLHPTISNFTEHSPLYMLLIMVCLAALLVPFHHKLEHWVTHRLVEKNNKLRLKAAKKVVATLESEQQV